MSNVINFPSAAEAEDAEMFFKAGNAFRNDFQSLMMSLANYDAMIADDAAEKPLLDAMWEAMVAYDLFIEDQESEIF